MYYLLITLNIICYVNAESAYPDISSKPTTSIAREKRTVIISSMFTLGILLTSNIKFYSHEHYVGVLINSYGG